MNGNQHKYYEAYEDRYRRVYAQGVQNWTADPEEVATVISQLEDFLEFARITPASGPVVEFGCGEGFLGEYLLRKGFSYLGIDIASAALDRARTRLPERASCFMLGDITNLSAVRSAEFAVALDNYCLHMLVMDEDRRKYLAEVKRVLRVGGYAWFREIGQTNRFEDRIVSFDDFLAKHPTDLHACEAREAWTPTGKKAVQLPRLAARFNNCVGYRQEIREAGLEDLLVEPKKGGIVIYAMKPEPDAESDAS